MTIADRLEALSAAIDTEAERVEADRGGGVLALAAAAGGGAGGEGGAIQPRAESLATVLTQVSVCRCWVCWVCSAPCCFSPCLLSRVSLGGCAG